MIDQNFEQGLLELKEYVKSEPEAGFEEKEKIVYKLLECTTGGGKEQYK